MIIGLLCNSLQKLCSPKSVSRNTENTDVMCAQWKSIPSSLHEIGTYI
jgi:hypothetical protein